MAEVNQKTIRDIKINTGVVKRVGKEKVMYSQEVIDQEKKIEKMKSNNADEHDIRKQIEVLGESQMMIPDCERRLKQAMSKLSKLLETEEDLSKTEEYRAAQEMLAASKELA